MCSNSHVLCRESSCACAAITALALRQILHFIDLKIAQAEDHENAMKLAKGQGLCICHVCVFACLRARLCLRARSRARRTVFMQETRQECDWCLASDVLLVSFHDILV